MSAGLEGGTGELKVLNLYAGLGEQIYQAAIDA